MATFVLLLLTASGCGMFENRHPRFATKDYYDVQWYAWGHNLQGDAWKQKAYEVVHRASEIETESDLKELGGIYANLTKTVVYTLADLERRGAVFRIRMTASGRAEIDLLKAPQAARGEGLLALVHGLDQAIEDHNSGNAIKRVQTAMSTMSRVEDMLRNRSLGTVGDRVYYLCNELRELRDTGRVEKVDLPRGIGWPEYEQLLFVMMARLEADHRQLRGFGATMAAVRLAVRAMDTEIGGSAANVAAIVEASVRDARDAAEVRRRMAQLPSDDATLERAAALGNRRFEVLIESDAYAAWGSEGGTARSLKRFGGELGTAARMFSIFFARDGGVDLVGEAEDALATGPTFAQLLAFAVEQAPVDSRLRTLLRRGQETAEAASQGKPIAEELKRRGASPAFALVHDQDEARAVFERLGAVAPMGR